MPFHKTPKQYKLERHEQSHMKDIFFALQGAEREAALLKIKQMSLNNQLLQEQGNLFLQREAKDP